MGQTEPTSPAWATCALSTWTDTAADNGCLHFGHRMDGCPSGIRTFAPQAQLTTAATTCQFASAIRLRTTCTTAAMMLTRIEIPIILAPLDLPWQA